ncbi:MAG: hypothetical protein DHS20C15_34990 [Planctomycetota bacterium]|nr:MAG: hypothetical protein DHS20C15_34990 [Planctomycetota bacterium]
MVDHIDSDQPPLIPEKFGLRFREHLISLEVTYETTEHPVPRIAVISGFALAHHGFLFWVTANHCLAELQKLHRSKKAHVGQVRWCDRFSNAAAQAIPTSIPEVLKYAIGREGPDVGVVVPRQNVQDLVAANENVVPLTLNQQVRDGFEHVGYCLVGLPHEALGAEVGESGDNWVTSWNGKIACITSHLEIPHDSTELPSPGQPDYMYGRIHLKGLIHDISGMSGGPVFAIGQRGSDWQYRLVGVQSAWFKNHQITCVAKIGHVEQMADRLCEHIQVGPQEDA